MKTKQWRAHHQLGWATHPMQDKHGHADHYDPGYIFPLWETWPIGTAADKVDDVYIVDGIKKEHFDDVIKSRDETYHVLGRFYYEYKEAIPLM